MKRGRRIEGKVGKLIVMSATVTLSPHESNWGKKGGVTASWYICSVGYPYLAPHIPPRMRKWWPGWSRMTWKGRLLLSQSFTAATSRSEYLNRSSQDLCCPIPRRLRVRFSFGATQMSSYSDRCISDSGSSFKIVGYNYALSPWLIHMCIVKKCNSLQKQFQANSFTYAYGVGSYVMDMGMDMDMNTDIGKGLDLGGGGHGNIHWQGSSIWTWTWVYVHVTKAVDRDDFYCRYKNKDVS